MERMETPLCNSALQFPYGDIIDLSDGKSLRKPSEYGAKGMNIP
jgi:hypothetical protein